MPSDNGTLVNRSAKNALQGRREGLCFTEKDYECVLADVVNAKNYKRMLVKAFTEQVVPHFCTESTHRLRPVADRAYPVAEIQEAHKYMESNQNAGKIVLELPQ